MQKESTRELFAQYVNAFFEPPAPAAPAPEPLDPLTRYPVIRDGGQIPDEFMPNLLPTRDQFAEWMGNKLQFDPFKTPDGWKSLF